MIVWLIKENCSFIGNKTAYSSVCGFIRLFFFFEHQNCFSYYKCQTQEKRIELLNYFAVKVGNE